MGLLGEGGAGLDEPRVFYVFDGLPWLGVVLVGYFAGLDLEDLNAEPELIR